MHPRAQAHHGQELLSAATDLNIALPSSKSGSATFSIAVKVGSRLKNWNTNPSLLLRKAESSLSLRTVMGSPSISIEPHLGDPARPEDVGACSCLSHWGP